jgi:tetratricopeptide (TPR) repeat protein
MVRKLPIVLALLSVAGAGWAQERRPRLDVQHYLIEAEINPATQSVSAKVQVQFLPQEDNATSAIFELNNALNVSKVEDASGRQIPASRSHQDFTIRLSFGEPPAKASPTAVTFYYDGRLSGNEDSPVSGVQFAALRKEYGYLLYPARWFPVSGYTADRYTAELKITVPAGYRVVASGMEKSEPLAAGKVLYSFQFTNPSFPGSLGVVEGEPARITSEGVVTSLYFRAGEREMAGAYGQEIGKVMTYLTSLYGLPPQANLTVVETEDAAPTGYAASGILFFSPQGIGKQVNTRLVVNQVSRQWWGTLLSGASRSHLWLNNGLARYSEMLYLEQVNGPAALESEARDVYIDALTINDVPVIQSPRLEDYSPEFWAVTASKGAATLHMLRYVIGDENFHKLLKEFPNKYPWGSVTTDDFAKVTEAVSGQNLKYFFLEWIESSGAPEFKLDYTIYRTQKGFRVMGKVAQDLDTFRMPVELKIETEGNPEQKRVDVMGPSSEFMVDTFGKPKTLALDPNNRVLRFSDPVRVAVAIRRGEQFVEISELNEALKEYQRALEVQRYSSLAHYRIAEVFFLQNNYQAAANEFREALNGNLEPKWTEVWSHINLGKIFDVTGQRERAVNEYELARRTKDNTQGALEEAAKYLKQPYERKKQPEN